MSLIHERGVEPSEKAGGRGETYYRSRRTLGGDCPREKTKT